MIENSSSPTLLVVDDNPDDQVLLQQAWQLTRPVNLYVLEDGEALLNFLEQQQCAVLLGQATQPSLILLDLRMPKKDGFTVLSELKSKSAFKSIPVIVLTTSNAQSDLNYAYELGANACLIKPDTFPELLQVVQAINQFWLETAALPG